MPPCARPFFRRMEKRCLSLASGPIRKYWKMAIGIRASPRFGLQAWDVKSGTRLLNVETAANEIRPGGQVGKSCSTGSSKSSPEYQPFTDVFDPASGEIAAHLELTYAYSTPRLDGRLALVSAYAGDERLTNLAILDEKTLDPVKVLDPWQGNTPSGPNFDNAIWGRSETMWGLYHQLTVEFNPRRGVPRNFPSSIRRTPALRPVFRGA